MSTIPVHCCCDPSRRLGFVSHPNLRRIGDRLWLALPPPWPALHPPRADDVPPGAAYVEIVVDSLEVDGEVMPAIKSQDRPIEWWLTVPGFARDEARI